MSQAPLKIQIGPDLASAHPTTDWLIIGAWLAFCGTFAVCGLVVPPGPRLTMFGDVGMSVAAVFRRRLHPGKCRAPAAPQPGLLGVLRSRDRRVDGGAVPVDVSRGFQAPGHTGPVRGRRNLVSPCRADDWRAGSPAARPSRRSAHASRLYQLHATAALVGISLSVHRHAVAIRVPECGALRRCFRFPRRRPESFSRRRSRGSLFPGSRALEDDLRAFVLRVVALRRGSVRGERSHRQKSLLHRQSVRSSARSGSGVVRHGGSGVTADASSAPRLRARLEDNQSVARKARAGGRIFDAGDGALCRSFPRSAAVGAQLPDCRDPDCRNHRRPAGLSCGSVW